MEDSFKELDKKVVSYLLDNNINEEDEADIMTGYKQLVRDGYIPAKHPQEAFKDVIDLHNHKRSKIRVQQKDEGKKQMYDPTVVARIHYLIDETAKKYGIKKKSEDFKELHTQADSVLEQMPDLDGKTPELFVESLFDIIVGGLPDKKTRKPYAQYKFSEATLQKKQARLERLALKKALREREEYMGIDMTDKKAGRAAKRAFNFEHGRYNVGRKAARTNRAWASWSEARKNAYLDRK